MTDPTTSAPSVTPVISASAVQKSWGDNVVFSDLTADVLKGVTGLLGSNGSGKTTFLGMLLGLAPAQRRLDQRARRRPGPRRPRAARADRLQPRAPRPSRRRAAAKISFATSRRSTVCPQGGDHPIERRALAGRAGRRAGSPHRHDVDRPAPAGQARPGDRPQPCAHPSRRAHRRTRPGAARRHARADPPDRNRIRHRRASRSHLLEEVERIADNVIILSNGTVRGLRANQTIFARARAACSHTSMPRPRKWRPRCAPRSRGRARAGTAPRRDRRIGRAASRRGSRRGGRAQRTAAQDESGAAVARRPLPGGGVRRMSHTSRS